MTACRRCQRLFAAALYGEAGAADRRELLAHLDRCPACRAAYAELEAIVAARPRREPPPLPESYWAGYQERLQRRLAAVPRRGAWSWRPVAASVWSRPALLAASALLLVALGMFIGLNLRPPPAARRGLVPSGGAGGRALLARHSGREPLADHLRSLEPLLIDWAQPAGGPAGVTVDAAALRQLLLQNLLLKRLLARTGQKEQQRLLEELELILLEMGGGDGRAVRQLIQRNDVLFKVKIFSRDTKSL